MGRLHRFSTPGILVVICLAVAVARAVADSEDAVQRTLAQGRQAMLERHYGRAVQIFGSGLKDHPKDNRLRLELGRAYLSHGSDKHAMRLFREILADEPDNREAELELGRALGYEQHYQRSNEIYRQLLSANVADEAAAIGLASNLLHQQRPAEARTVVETALAFHPNSLRLQEYKDRIESGSLGGEERPAAVLRNEIGAGAEYINDSAGNHSWISLQHLELGITPGLTNRFLFEQQFQHSREDSFEAVEVFNEALHWKPRDRLLLSGGGGAVRFNNHDVHAIYDTSVAVLASRHLVLGATFSRVPIIPGAEASEHRLAAEGWQALGNWTPVRWQITANWTRQHYSDGNIGSRQNLEVTHEWGTVRLTVALGYRYRRYAFDQELEHGYFSPKSYQSHLGIASISSRIGKRYRGAFVLRGGMESPSSDSPFRTAWEIHARNEVRLANWTLELDYSKYHLIQETGAFRADAGRFAFAYHF